MYDVSGASWLRQPRSRSASSKRGAVIHVMRACGACATISSNTSTVRRRHTLARVPSGDTVRWNRSSSTTVDPGGGARYAGGSCANALSVGLKLVHRADTFEADALEDGPRRLLRADDEPRRA